MLIKRLVVSAALAAFLPPAWALTAPSVLVFDPASGADLVADGADTPRPPASTTKLMTALLASERLALDARLRVSPHAAAMPRTKADLRTWESYPVRTLLEALLVGSSNDAAVVLAEGVAGSEARFADLMNAKAKALGCRHTHFDNASGLSDARQLSTCRDLVRIFAAVRRSPVLMDILATPSVSIVHPGGGRTELRNHNKLLGGYASAPVGKTGWTRTARHCFVGTFTRDGHEYYVACMGSARLWDDLRALTTGETPSRPRPVRRRNHRRR